MNRDERKKLFLALSVPLPEQAIQRTSGAQTGRGYDTSGYGYIWLVSRLNDLLGVGGWRTQQSFSVRTSTTAKGRAIFEVTCDVVLQLGEWAGGVFLPFCEVVGTGGHASTMESDAKKGAYTNGFKKAAAMTGVGKAAFEGLLDDDHAPLPSVTDEQREATREHRPRTDGAHERNRLTSKQLAALWTLAKKLDIDRVAFRNRVRERFGVTPEFLSRESASSLISELSAKLGNGHARDHGEQPEVA